MTTEMTTRRRTRAQTNMARQLEKMATTKSMETDQDETFLITALDNLDDPVPEGITDVDEAETSKYVRHNTAYLAYLEHRHLPQDKGAELLQKCGIKGSWRHVLLDWLHDIVIKCQLMKDTYFMAAGLLDRYFDSVNEQVAKQNVQKLGIVALFLAAKYEEIYPPSIDDLVDYCDGAYTAEDLLKCEIDMFAMLNFDLAQPYALQFLRRFAHSKKDELDGETYMGAKMLIELSTLDNELIGVPFSVIAAAALKQSMNTCQPELVWDADLCYWTGFTSTGIEVIVNHMARLVKMAARSGSRKPMGKVAGRHRRALPSFRLTE